MTFSQFVSAYPKLFSGRLSCPAIPPPAAEKSTNPTLGFQCNLMMCPVTVLGVPGNLSLAIVFGLLLLEILVNGEVLPGGRLDGLTDRRMNAGGERSLISPQTSQRIAHWPEKAYEIA